MVKDYSSFGPAYRNFKVREDVYVPEPVAEFSGDNPFTRMAAIRGKNKDIKFDETYTYLDKSFKFNILNAFMYFVAWFVAFPLNRIRFGLKIEGRDKIRKNRKLFANGVMTVCNHVHRWDMICVLQAMRYRKAWIPMYSQPFNGKDGFVMKAVGGIAIPDNYNGLRKFEQALNELRSKNQWIHIFPESCSWNFYAPLRPFKTGAFNMAYRYSLPVIPMIISFRPRTGWRKLFGKGEPLLTIHVGDPIIPDLSKNRKEESARMCDLAHKTMLDMAGIVSNPWPSYID
ncbi:MAG: 1-acyl-sn-glycerol-3-phosphate acyltransferase [Bacteroidales bacterium]|nr:1-acyl-sn-glycerol-3-phosphate acyltransferase [Bacteroidales bacterium]